jgi:hypothetical protein
MRLFISSILTVTMIGFVPLSYAEQGGSHVQLSDGSKAPKDHVNNVRSSLQRLSKESPIKLITQDLLCQTIEYLNFSNTV